MKTSKSDRFSNDFRGNRGEFIRLNSLNIRSEIWYRRLTGPAESKNVFYMLFD